MVTQLEWSIKLQEVYHKAKELDKFTKEELSIEVGDPENSNGKYISMLRSLNLLKTIRTGAKIYYKFVDNEEGK